MKTLILLRHVKSSWSNHQILDHKRDISKTGYKQISKLMLFINDKKCIPDFIHSSDSSRALKTLNHIQKELPKFKKKIKINRSKKMYLIDDILMKNIIRNTPNNYKKLMIINHEPCIRALLFYLLNKKDKILNNLIFSIPASSIFVLVSKKNNWKNIKKGDFNLVNFQN